MLLRFFVPVAALAASTLPVWAQGSPLTDTSLTTEQRAQGVVKQMTLEEKISQMMDRSPAIPRLGIPEYNWWNEALHGVARSGYATMFPQAIGMAASWDADLLHEEARVISTEARAKYNNAIAHDNHQRYFGLTIWSPNINIFRDPRWGRGQETLGEDPTLTGTLGSAFVRGLQGDDPKYLEVVATPKHFAVHSGPESTRHKANIEPSAYDLESTYLPAFRKTIVEAKADSIMCAYNAVHGEPACANTMLLQQKLRGDWQFKGFVTSDCGAVQDFYDGHGFSPDAAHAAAKAVLAGTDTDCGDEYKSLKQAVEQKLLPESAIDTAVERLFEARIRLGMFDPKAEVAFNSIPFSQNDSAPHAELALQAAREAMVLLKNNKGTLPLRSGQTIAVVGPNASSLLALEGNYNGVPSHPVLPVDALERQFGQDHVLYAQGSPYAEGITLPAARSLFHTADGKPGLQGEYYANSTLSGTPAATRVDREIDFNWDHAAPVPQVSSTDFSVRWTGTLTAPAAGSYSFAMMIGRCSECANKTDKDELAITFDGKPLDLSQPNPTGDGWNTRMPAFDLQFADTKPHSVVIEFRHKSIDMPAAAVLRWMAPVAAERDEAVAAAKQADAVVAFVGLNSELEGEESPIHIPGFAGGDRTAIDLPAPQQQLLAALAATGKPLVVVLMNGSALAVNWSKQHADAILESWYPGEAGGTAIAETLAGLNNPGGKLPLTFYTGVGQLPAFDDYSMKNRTYRYFKGQPLYGFGYGLSYTSFVFSPLKLSSKSVQAGQPLTVQAEVKNTGQVAGDEVAELYLAPPQNSLSPQRQLVGFARVHLQPGEVKPVSITLDPRAMSVVDAAGNRAMKAGSYSLFLGGSQPGAPDAPTGATARFRIKGEAPLAK